MYTFKTSFKPLLLKGGGRGEGGGVKNALKEGTVNSKEERLLSQLCLRLGPQVNIVGDKIMVYT